MPGHILLAGGAEFGGRMAEPDRRAIELAGGFDAGIRIIPTAAAPDNNQVRASGNGKKWFAGLGATHVAVANVVDRTTADDPMIAAELRTARLIYLLGGFTHYLGQTLAGSAAWDAAQAAYLQGAVLAGSSAGAMVLCAWYYDPGTQQVHPGLGLVPGALVLPHHDTFGHRWAPHLTAQRPDLLLIGIDERTGLIDDGAGGSWNVYGQGAVTLYRHGQSKSYRPGEPFDLA
jgi:cyanophycinase